MMKNSKPTVAKLDRVNCSSGDKKHHSYNDDICQGLIHPKLASIGKESICKSGTKFGRGSREYRKMSYMVASFAKEVGINLLRKGGGTSMLLLPMPPGEYAAHNEKSAYSNNRNLPSTALAQTKETADFLTCYAYEAYKEGSSFFSVTLPATNERRHSEDLSRSITSAWKHLEQLEDFLDATAGYVPQVLFAQLETPYDVKTQSFFPHFHLIVETDGSEEAESALTKGLKHYREYLGIGSVSTRCEQIPQKSFSATVFYCAKPSTTAFEIAQAGHKEVFKLYIEGPSKKHHRRSQGGYQSYKVVAASEGLKPQKVHQDDGSWTLELRTKDGDRGELAERAAPKSPSAEVQGRRNGDVDSHSATTGRSAEEGGSDARENEEPHNGNTDKTRGDLAEDTELRENIFCGVVDPVPVPGNKLVSYAVFRNFEPQSFNSGDRGFASYEVANEEARRAWEKNTGKPYTLKEFLRPLALELIEAAEEQSNVQYYTISFSPRVQQVLEELKEEILKERNTRKHDALRSPARLAWARITSKLHGFWRRLGMRLFC